MRLNCCGNAWTVGAQRCMDCPNWVNPPTYQAPNTGWICPKCSVVHAPWVNQCHCASFPQGPNCGPHLGSGNGGGIAGDG